MKNELKPCPFCGGEASTAIGTGCNGEPWHYIECLECAGMADNEKSWQSRPIEDALRADASAKEAEIAQAREDLFTAECRTSSRETEIAALKAELARWKEPLTAEQIDRIGVLCAHLPMYGNEYDWWDMRDAAIRAAREGVR